MLFVQVCVGSSCHLKGSQDIVELLEKAVEEHHVDDDIHVGITRENFREFFKKNILDVIEGERK